MSHTLRSLGDEVSNRLLGPRERTRIGATLAFAAEDIQGRLERGQKLRVDCFLNLRDNGRSAAEEIAEGVLLTAQREHEEKKLKYLGRFLSEISFNSRYDRAHANYMNRIG